MRDTFYKRVLYIIIWDYIPNIRLIKITKLNVIYYADVINYSMVKRRVLNSTLTQLHDFICACNIDIYEQVLYYCIGIGIYILYNTKLLIIVITTTNTVTRPIEII